VGRRARGATRYVRFCASNLRRLVGGLFRLCGRHRWLGGLEVLVLLILLFVVFVDLQVMLSWPAAWLWASGRPSLAAGTGLLSLAAPGALWGPGGPGRGLVDLSGSVPLVRRAR